MTYIFNMTHSSHNVKYRTSNIRAQSELEAAGPGVELLYFSGWNPPYIHFRKTGGQWTVPPGVPMVAASGHGFSKEEQAGELWSIHIDKAQARLFTIRGWMRMRVFLRCVETN